MATHGSMPVNALSPALFIGQSRLNNAHTMAADASLPLILEFLIKSSLALAARISNKNGVLLVVLPCLMRHKIRHTSMGSEVVRNTA